MSDFGRTNWEAAIGGFQWSISTFPWKSSNCSLETPISHRLQPIQQMALMSLFQHHSFSFDFRSEFCDIDSIFARFFLIVIFSVIPEAQRGKVLGECESVNVSKENVDSCGSRLDIC
jgi:hypothetical protein